MSVPFGAGEGGLPIGVQVLAPALGEEPGCSASPGRWRRAAMTATGTPRPGVRGRHRARGALRARDRDEAVLRLPERVRRGAEHERLPGVPRAARARCRCSTSRPSRSRCGSRRPSHLHVPGAVDRSPARTTSIPDMPKDYPDLAVRGADHDRRLDRRRRRAHRHRARPPRGGHRQVDPRRWRRPHPRSRVLARRLQPRRRAADGDREPTRHPLAPSRRAAYVAELRSRARGDRRLRREDGRGLDARRRERVGATGRDDRSSASKVEIKNMNSLRSLGRAIEHEIAAPDRRASSRASGSCRRRATGTRPTAAPARCARRKGSSDYRYFPEPDLVPVAPTDEMRARVRDEMPELPGGAPGAARRRVGHHGEPTRACSSPRPGSPSTRRPPSRRSTAARRRTS